jgi:hypothetical protein
MNLELTIQDDFDITLLINCIDTMRYNAMRKYQELAKPTTQWKNETEEELSRLEQLRNQLFEQLKV